MKKQDVGLWQKTGRNTGQTPDDKRSVCEVERRAFDAAICGAAHICTPYLTVPPFPPYMKRRISMHFSS